MKNLETKVLMLDHSEMRMLFSLLRMSKDDPRVSGLIGTCFWGHASNDHEEAEIKKTWTSVETKLQRLLTDN
jgi:hypothetical protein|tara:strand:+ start:517 stop:732 length:216 start_codon:yes stop_codon:yes gene_type:complete